jgi:hypothetical protein
LDSVKLVFEAWSNISYKYIFDTEMSQEEWDLVEGPEQEDIARDALFADIDWRTTNG